MSLRFSVLHPVYQQPWLPLRSVARAAVRQTLAKLPEGVLARLDEINPLFIAFDSDKLAATLDSATVARVLKDGRDGKRPVVYLSPNIFSKRHVNGVGGVEYIIAHELAHAILHDGETDPSRWRQHEREADELVKSWGFKIPPSRADLSHYNDFSSLKADLP